jgi:aminoglycoside phosphotransferase (APT) family kinase protein
MHPGTYPIDDNLVRRLIAGQFPQWSGLAVHRWPSGGTVNAMGRLGDGRVKFSGVLQPRYALRVLGASAAYCARAG